MNWYLAKVVFRIICGNGNHQPQFDEQLRLITAEEEQQAFEKARLIGEQEAETFFNQEQQLVQWKFIGVPELYPLGELMDGAEMYSRIQEPDDANAYTDMVNKRAMNLESGNSYKFLPLL